MADEDGISSRMAAVLMALCGVVAIALVVVLLVQRRSEDPLHRYEWRPTGPPIQRRYDTDSIGRQERPWTPPPTVGTAAKAQQEEPVEKKKEEDSQKENATSRPAGGG